MPNKRTALVIATDIDLVNCAVIRLRASGFETITATRTRDGMRHAVEQQPSVIIIDTNMPDIDGPQAVRWLQQQDETRAIPVVLVSEDCTDDVKARATAQQWVRRPFKEGRLIDTVNNAIETTKLNNELSITSLLVPDRMRANIIQTNKVLQGLVTVKTDAVDESEKQPQRIHHRRRAPQYLRPRADQEQT